MLSLEQINRINAERARRSRGVHPVAIPLAVLERCSSLSELANLGYRVPHIGDRRPTGYKPYGTAVFIDISGFGEDDEPALSFRQTLEFIRNQTRVKGTLHWALTIVGEFQGYLQAYQIRERKGASLAEQRA